MLTTFIMFSTCVEKYVENAYIVKLKTLSKKVKKVVDNGRIGWYYIRALERAQELRSLKTEQETSIQKQLFRKQRTQSSFIESNQMESLILAQDERWRHA